MNWVIICRDADGAQDIRRSVLPDHLRYMTSAPFPITLAGPLTRPDGTGSFGSLIVADAEDRTIIADFIDRAPFAQNGVWSSWEIYAFSPTV